MKTRTCIKAALLFSRAWGIAALLLMAALPVDATNSGLSIDDRAREQSLKFYHGDPNLKLDKHESRHPDGARGFTFFEAPEHAPQSSHGPATLRYYACNLAVFGVADLEDSRSFVGKDEIGILTKLRFRIVDDWRWGSKSKNQIFDVIIPWGEVMHKGEIFRLSNPLAAYVKGRRYLMVVHRAWLDAASENYFVGVPRLLEVSDGIIRSPFSALPFESGMRLSLAKASVREALQQQGCG